MHKDKDGCEAGLKFSLSRKVWTRHSFPDPSRAEGLEGFVGLCPMPDYEWLIKWILKLCLLRYIYFSCNKYFSLIRVLQIQNY